MVDDQSNVLLISRKEFRISQLLAQKVKSVTSVLSSNLVNYISEKNSYFPEELSSKICYISNDDKCNSKILKKHSRYDVIIEYELSTNIDYERLNENSNIKKISFHRFNEIGMLTKIRAYLFKGFFSTKTNSIDFSIRLNYYSSIISSRY